MAILSLDVPAIINALYYKHHVYACPEYCSLKTPFEACSCVDVELTKVFGDRDTLSVEEADYYFGNRVVDNLSPSSTHLNDLLEIDSTSGEVTVRGYSKD